MRNLAVALLLMVALGLLGALVLQWTEPPPDSDCVGRLQDVHQFGERYRGELQQIERDCRR